MEFKEHIGGGIPFYLNGELSGWICITLNGQYTWTLAKYNIDHQDRFDDIHDAKIALMAVFGE